MVARRPAISLYSLYFDVIIYLIIVFISLILAYSVFQQKSWGWLGSLMLSSFLLYRVFTVPSTLAYGVSSNLHYLLDPRIIVLCLEFVFAILVIYLSTRQDVKAYFGKT